MRSGCSSKRHRLCQVTLSLRRATSFNADSKQCKHQGWLHSALSDPHRFCQPWKNQRLFHWAQSPNPYFAKRNNFLNHHLILWQVSWSTLLSLSSPTHYLGVVTGKRTSEKCSKSKSQENSTDFQCVLCCIATQSCWEKKICSRLRHYLQQFCENALQSSWEKWSFLLQQVIQQMGCFRGCTSGRALAACKELKNTSGPISDTHSFPFGKVVLNNSPVTEVTDGKMLYCPKLESLQQLFPAHGSSAF